MLIFVDQPKHEWLCRFVVQASFGNHFKHSRRISGLQNPTLSLKIVYFTHGSHNYIPAIIFFYVCYRVSKTRNARSIRLTQIFPHGRLQVVNHTLPGERLSCYCRWMRKLVFCVLSVIVFFSDVHLTANTIWCKQLSLNGEYRYHEKPLLGRPIKHHHTTKRHRFVRNSSTSTDSKVLRSKIIVHAVVAYKKNKIYKSMEQHTRLRAVKCLKVKWV